MISIVTRTRVKLAAAIIMGTVSLVSAQGFRNVGAWLNGFQEVPAIVNDGTGRFRAQIDEGTGQISFELSYALEGAVQQAHIHVGNAGTNGGVAAFLCTNLGNSSAPACPAAQGTVSGILTAGDILGPSNQGVAPGEFDELVRAIRAGAAYVNVHSDAHPGGEIRGQIAPGFRRRSR